MKLIKFKVNETIAYPNNDQTHLDDQFNGITESIQEIGITNSVLIKIQSVNSTCNECA